MAHETAHHDSVEVAPDPHESPWLMTVPLVSLAALSVLGGVLELPWVHHSSIAGFISQSILTLPSVASSSSAQWVLEGVDVVAAIIGILVAMTLWRETTPWPRYESTFLERVWRWDDAYDTVLGRPSQHVAQFAGDVVEPLVIDGAVSAVGVLVRRSADGLRKMQSGFLRHYALGIVLGMSVLIVFLLVSSW